MHTFQITSRTVQPSGAPKKRITHIRQRWYAILRVVCGVLILVVLFALFGKTQLSPFFFILLPVSMSSIITIILTRYRHNTALNGTLVYGLFTIGLAFLYYGSIAALELLTHPPNINRVILISTTLVLTVLFEPLRTRAQAFIEQRFNLRNYEAVKAIEAFTSTLREEIDLDKVRDGLLTVVQKTLQPQSVSVWTQKVGHIDGESLYEPSLLEINVTDTDPMIAYALRHPGAIEVDRLQLDSSVLHTLKTHEVQMVLPLASQGELIGLLTLGPRLDGQEYAREEQSLLNTLTAQVAPALRVAQMVQEQQAQIREHERIEQELRTAQEIQHAFLPKDVPVLPGWQLVPYYQPAREVGGDFYDFLPFADGRLGIVIGDVTGKGVPAALVMATTHTMFRIVAQDSVSPAEALARVNDLLSADIAAGMFVTCFYAILDPQSGKLHYANAGHEPPYRRHNGSASELWATGMPLGMMPGTRYEEYEAILAPGESLLFYSDGLVEAHNASREMLGFPRIKNLLEEHSAQTSLIDFLLRELKSFTGEGWEQEDDITLVTLQSMSESFMMNEQQKTPHLPCNPPFPKL